MDGFGFGFGFGFDCMIDVIEEEALNRKYCIEVLRKLISKSKRDIEKLEAKMFVLQTQLEWANSNKEGDVIELCSKALREKIDSLKLATCNLKNNNDHNDENGIAFQQHENTEPQKEIHETISTVLRNALYEKEQDGQQADKNLIEDGSDATKTSVGHSNDKQNFDIVASKEKDLTKSEQIDVQEPRISATAKDGKQADKTAKEARQDALKTSFSQSDQNSNMIGSKEKSIPELKQVEIQEPRIPATAKSSLMLEGRKEIVTKSVKVEPQESTSSTIDNVCLKSDLMLQSQKAKEIANARANSATCNVVPLKLSVGGKRQRKDMTKPENISLADHPNNGDLRSALMLQGQKERSVAQTMQIMAQEPRTSVAGKIIGSKASLKVQGTNSIIRGGEPLVANPRMSLDSDLKALEFGKTIVKLEEVSVQLGETHAGKNVIRSTKGKAKYPNQMYPPDSGFGADNSQTSVTPITYKRTYKRTKKPVMSNFGGAKDPGKLPTNRFDGDSFFKQGENSMSLITLDTMDSKESVIVNTDTSGALIGPVELRKSTIPELKSLAKARGFIGYSKYRKEQLVQLLTEVKVNYF